MKKRVLALLLAALMLLALFSACAAQPDDTSDKGSTPDVGDTPDGGNDGKTDGDGQTDDDGQDAPVETDPIHLEYMGRESHNWTYTLEEAQQQSFESLVYYNQRLLEKYNLVVDVSPIDNESYKTTLSGYLASNSLPDSFLSESMMDESLLVNTIASGKFADIDDIVALSDGTFSGLIAEGQPLAYLKAWSTAPDGHWYMVKNTDNQSTGFNFDTADTDYLVDFTIYTWYNLSIRQDWLNKLNLSMPTTTQEFKDALVQFQANDVNGNGAADERAFLGIGIASGEGSIFSNGVAGWFGLYRDNFAMDSSTGKIVNAIECEGYIPYVNYMSELYGAGVALMNEGLAFQSAVNCAGNYCSAHPQYPNTMMTVSTGDEESDYEPMPIIQAIEGVKPHLLGQGTVSSGRALSFSTEADYQAAAYWLDWLFSEEFAFLFQYGIEGKAWEWKEDGSFYKYQIGVDFTQEEEERLGDMWCYAPWCLFPQMANRNLYGIAKATYNSIDEAFDAGEPYTYELMTFEEWKAQFADYNWTDISPLERFLRQVNDYGTDQLYFDMHANFLTLASEDEANVINTYYSDLSTYLSEMTTNYIVGISSIDNYEADLQYAYDNLGMKEYMDVQQTRIDRYLVTLGREPILG